MTATLALLLAQILLDHTAVLVTLDMKETERQAAIGFQARTSEITLKIHLLVTQCIYITGSDVQCLYVTLFDIRGLSQCRNEPSNARLLSCVL